MIGFSDAFYTLWIRENERKYVTAKGTDSWVSFMVVAFGFACGPLLWGRLAASACRLAQAMFQRNYRSTYTNIR